MVGDPSPSSILTQDEKEPKSLDANSAESPSKHLAAVQVWITPASEKLISTHFQLFSAVVTISSSNTRLKISFNIHPPAPVFFSFSIKSLFFSLNKSGCVDKRKGKQQGKPKHYGC